MQQLISVWSVLDLQKRAIVILATLAMFAAILGISRMASQPSMSLLYAGLESATAGDVVKALEARGAKYDIRGGAIYVASAQRDELRMNMASEGLPANSGGGYEILDNLSGFGTTSQMFNAAYWRAQEGELARTITTSPMIQSARVHLGSPNSQGLRQRSAPTASVTVTTTSGALSAGHAKALKYMIASAVSGLLPENVSVIDSQGGLILASDEAASGGANGASRADELRQNIKHLLEARVGYGNVVVEVSVETVTERESIIERIIDPESRIAISSEIEENAVSTTTSQGAGVSVASNLPSGEGAVGGGESTSSNSETRERLNYEVSETTREIVRMPGAVRRLSVAVLINGIQRIDDSGQETWAPRSEEELAALHDLIASTVGFDEARGDIITIKSLEFKQIAPDLATTAPGFLQSLNLDIMSLLQLAVLAIVTLILGLFVLRPLLSTRVVGQDLGLSQVQPGGLPSNSALTDHGLSDFQNPDIASLPALTGEIDDGSSGFPTMGTVTDISFDDGFGSDLPALGSNSSDPVERLRSLIEERQSETVEILRGWMENDEETA